MSGEAESLTPAFAGWFLGMACVYGALFGTGFLLYGNLVPGVVSLVVSGAALRGIFMVLPKIGLRG